MPALCTALFTGVLMAFARSAPGYDMLLLDRVLPGAGWAQVVLAAVLAWWLYGKLIDPATHNLWRRRLWWLFSAIFFGQFFLGLAVDEIFLMTGRLHFPVPMMIEAGPLYRMQFSFMPILFLITVLISGGAWCSQLCYMGGADMAAAAATRRKGIVRPVRGRWWMRGGAVVIVAAVALILRATEAPGWLAVALVAAWGAAGWAIVAFVSRRKGQMVHCNVYCPIGAMVSVLKWVNPVRIRFSMQCTGCMKCAAVCRYAAITARDMERGRPAFNCTACGDCHAVCAHSGVEYGLPFGKRAARTKRRSERVRKAYTIIVVALYVSFVMLARI